MHLYLSISKHSIPNYKKSRTSFRLDYNVIVSCHQASTYVVLSHALAEVVLAHLYSTELTVDEIALSQVPVITNDSSFKQLKSLYGCVESIKSWFEVFFSIPPAKYTGFPFSIFSQFVHCLVTLYTLSTLNDPAWDKNGVGETANLLLILDQLINNLEQAATMAGLDNHDSTEGEVFSQTAKKFRSVRPEWEAKLKSDNLMVPTFPTLRMPVRLFFQKISPWILRTTTG